MRLVERGHLQVESIKYTEMYDLVVTFTFLRILLAVVIPLNLLLLQVDVVTMFLIGYTDECV